jgi:hypothetical protein
MVMDSEYGLHYGREVAHASNGLLGVLGII